jgi:hypothetical protein
MKMSHGSNWDMTLHIKIDEMINDPTHIYKQSISKNGNNCKIIQNTKKNGKLAYYLYVNNKRITNQLSNKSKADEYLAECINHDEKYIKN